MKNKIIINVNNINDIDDFKKVGITTFLFALKNYCVGYEKEFDIEEINNLNLENKYILINRVLDCQSVDKLKTILSKNLNITGIIYEDIAVYQIIKELKKDLDLIFFQNHFNSNIGSINFWLDRVNSVIVCNELTKEELTYITNNAKKEVVVQAYGYNQAMYSRRLLLSNFCNEFKLDKRKKNTLIEKVSGLKFLALENDYGTVLYYGKIFNGLELMSLPNVKYFYINTTFINHEEIMKVLDSLDGTILDTDDGFLNKETIYKLKGGK